MLNLLKKSDTTKTEKTAVKMTKDQKPTTTVANISGKVKNAAFGVATGATVAGTMMIQNERNIKGRKARAEYHKRVEQVCTVAVGAAIVGAGASIVQAVFDPVIDVSMLEIEPSAYLELNDKASELQEAKQKSEATEPVEAEAVPEQTAEQPAEKVVAEIVQTSQPTPASAPKAEQPVVEATATEVASEQTPAAPVTPADPAPVPQTPADPAAAPAPVAKQPADPAPAAQTSQPKSKNGNNNKNANAAK